MKSPGGGSRQIRRSRFGVAWGVVVELDCADRVRKTQTATSITAVVTNVVLTELEFIAHPPVMGGAFTFSWRLTPAPLTPDRSPNHSLKAALQVLPISPLVGT